MATIGELVAQIKADTSDLKRGLAEANTHVRGFSSHTGRSLKGVESTVLNLKRTILGLAGTAGIGILTKSFIQAASEAESYRVRLEVLLRSQSEGARAFKEMAEYAAKVPHTYRDIMASATNLSGIMRGGVDEIKQWMPMIGDLAAATGLSIQETTGQIIRMYSAGAATADMFRERGVLAMLGFKAGVHYSAEETRRMVMESWNKMDSQWKGTADKLGETWIGLTSMMSDRWFQIRKKVMEAGLFEIIKEKIDFVIRKIDEFEKSGKLEEWTKYIGNKVVYVVEVLTKGIHILKESFNKLVFVTKAYIAMRVGNYIGNIAEMAVLATKNIHTLGEAILGLKAKILALGLAGKGGLAGLALFGGWEIGTWLKEKFEIIDKFGIIVAKSLRIAFEKAGFEIKQMFLEVKLEALKMWNWAKEIYENIKKFPERLWLGESGPQYTPIYWDEIVLEKKLEIQRNQFKRHLELISQMYARMMKTAGTNIPWWEDMQSVDSFSHLQNKGLGFVPLGTNLNQAEQLFTQFTRNINDQWDNFTENMHDSFVSNFESALWDGENLLEAFAKDIGRMFTKELASAFSVQYLRPVFDSLTRGIMPFLGMGMAGVNSAGLSQEAIAYGPIGMGTAGGAAWMPYLGAGAMGYGMGGMGGAAGAMGGFALGGPIGMIAGGLLGGLTGDLFGGGDKGPSPYDIMRQQADQAWQEKELSFGQSMTETISSAISAGFMAAYESQEYQTFIDALKGDLGGSVTEMFDKLMMAEALTPLMNLFEPMFELIEQRADPDVATAVEWGKWRKSEAERINARVEEIKTTKQGTSGWNELITLGAEMSRLYDPNYVSTYGGRPFTNVQWEELASRADISTPQIMGAAPTPEELANTLTDLQKPFTAITDALHMVKDSLGLNTDAITENTSAMIGPLESLMRDLTVGNLAPGMSLEGLESTYESLLAGAMLDSSKISEFASFAGSTYLPGMEPFDYAKVTEQVKADVGAVLGQYQKGEKIQVTIMLNGRELATEVLAEVGNSAELTGQLNNLVVG